MKRAQFNLKKLGLFSDENAVWLSRLTAKEELPEADLKKLAAFIPEYHEKMRDFIVSLVK
ncbi:hypothetical protein JXA05_03500 [Candidatus Peregrinibacteria bacterium]|nr:hypothetical protein [Candidatus Peregrinibacteria bacterium]